MFIKFILCFSLLLTYTLQAKHHKSDLASIFDGKTLKGWTQLNGTASYRVEKGSIIGKTIEGSPNSFLCSDKLYGDFELQFQVKLINDELNSGVQIRSQCKELTDEATKENGAESGYIYGEACGGWMTSKDDLKPHKYFKNGEWNQYRIVAKGHRIQTWVNGNKVSDLVDKEKHKSHPKGFIGLQVHGIKKGSGPYEVSWKNIKIKELSQK